MKAIVKMVPVTVYQARDGSEFETAQLCEEHEQLLDFREYKIDPDLGPISESNYMQHYHNFLYLCFREPERYAFMFNKSKNGLDYQQIVNTIVVQALSHVSSLNRLHNVHMSNYLNLDVIARDIFEFLFIKCGLKGTDIPIYYAPLSQGEEPLPRRINNHQVRLFRLAQDSKDMYCFDILFNHAGCDRELFGTYYKSEVRNHHKEELKKYLI